MAQQTHKDSYVFDFLTLQEEHIEYDIEQGLIELFHDKNGAVCLQGRNW
jgi:predicted nuclease of restriction endonuclease-like (RecB) superfamily